MRATRIARAINMVLPTFRARDGEVVWVDGLPGMVKLLSGGWDAKSGIDSIVV
jgi:hypothetical protein